MIRHLEALVAVWLVAALAAPAAAESGRARPADRFDAVVLDPGHGGEDDGARSGGGLVEKDVVLDVSRRLAARLRNDFTKLVHFGNLRETPAVVRDAVV